MIIRFNRKMRRYEVYGPQSVVRNVELQPLFVCRSLEAARDYVWRVKA